MKFYHKKSYGLTTVLIIIFKCRPTDPQNMNCLPKQNSTGASSGRRHPSGSLEPCVEPENENTNMPILLSPALSKASSGYFPQSSFTSTHSYYSTAEDNNIEEEKTSGGKKIKY